jgi:threonine-phosphate decarboxylase
MHKKNVDFTNDVNPFAASGKVKAVLRKAVKDCASSPLDSVDRLQKRLAAYHRISIDNILVGAGATALIHLAIHRLNPQTRLALAPAASERFSPLSLIPSKAAVFPLDEQRLFSPPIEQWLDEIRKGYQLVCLYNPDPITGNCLTVNVLQSLAAAVQSSGGVLMIDESFADFMPEEISFIEAVNKFDNTLVIRGFSQFYGLAGLRIGYLIACSATIQSFAPLNCPNTVTSFSAKAALAAFNDKRYRQEIIRQTKDERNYLNQELTRLGFQTFDTQINSILVKGIDSRLILQLLDAGYALTDCEQRYGFKGGYARISVKRHVDNARLIKTLKMILKGG